MQLFNLLGVKTIAHYEPHGELADEKEKFDFKEKTTYKNLNTISP